MKVIAESIRNPDDVIEKSVDGLGVFNHSEVKAAMLLGAKVEFLSLANSKDASWFSADGAVSKNMDAFPWLKFRAVIYEEE